MAQPPSNDAEIATPRSILRQLGARSVAGLSLALLCAGAASAAAGPLGAQVETNVYLPSRQNSCFGSSLGLSIASVSERSCEQSVTPAAQGLPAEYTATVSGSARAARDQLPALSGLAEVTRYPRMGAVSAYEIRAESVARSRSFLAWNRATPVSQLQFELTVSGQTLITTPIGALYNVAGYALEATMQRGYLDSANNFTPYVGATTNGGLGVVSLQANTVSYGLNGAGTMPVITAYGGYANAFSGVNPAVFAAGTGVEVWSGLADQPEAPVTWRSLTLTGAPYFPDTSVTDWLQANPSMGQRLRISLGLDFLGPGAGAPAGSVEGALFDFSANTFAWLTQEATVSHPDDIVFHTGQVRSEFSHTFEVSDLRFYDQGLDVTAQAGGAFAASFAEAAALAAPVPEPEVALLWLGGLLLLTRRVQARGPGPA